TPIPFLIVALIWARGSSFELLDFRVVILVGFALSILGEILRINSILHAGGATRTRDVGAPELISSGPYSHTRNPLYIANMMIYMGIVLASAAFFPYFQVFGLIFFGIQYSMIVSLEEESLKKLFGERYAKYCAKVPRLLPRLIADKDLKKPANLPLSAALRQERSTLIAFSLSWILLLGRIHWLPIVNY
nr:isoprenylcysteine carboxylmethyltransferase family protein [bacterium]